MKKSVTLLLFLVVLFNVTLIACTEKGVFLTEEKLEQIDFQEIDVIEDNTIFVKTEEFNGEINNIKHSGKNPNGINYFFLSTEIDGKYILVVLNEPLNKIQYGAYYSEHCYFDPEELVAIVVDPFPVRHLEATVNVYDFTIDHFLTREFDLSFPEGTNKGNKQAYYKVPIFEKTPLITGSLAAYTIYWKQGHYSFADDTYSLQQEFRGDIYTSSDSSTLDELIPLEYSMERWNYPKEYSPIGRNINNDIEVVIMSPKDKTASWANYKIYTLNHKTKETSIVSFADLFEYQDDLINVTAAENRDDRIAFIIETKEFSYDFYFDPDGENTETFLRPSSYIRLYPR